MNLKQGVSGDYSNDDIFVGWKKVEEQFTL